MRKSESRPRIARITFAVITAAGLVSLGYVLKQGANSPQTSKRIIDSKLITASITQTSSLGSQVFRGDVTSGFSSPINPPAADGSKLVVTEVSVHNDQKLYGPALLGSVNLLPVFVMQGTIPSFRNITEGERGVDISELQAALEHLGFSTAPDPRGLYSVGTANAISTALRHYGFVPSLSVGVQANGQPTTLQYPTLLATQLNFIKSFPLLVSNALQTGTILQGTTSPFLTLSSSPYVIDCAVSPNESQNLKPLESATATNDVTGATWKLTLRSISNSLDENGLRHVIFALPTLGLSPQLGDNLRVTINGGAAKEKYLVVPISAIYTSTDGPNFLNVVSRGKVIRTEVRLGIEVNGLIEVQGKDFKIHAGEAVEIGTLSQLRRG